MEERLVSAKGDRGDLIHWVNLTNKQNPNGPGMFC